MHTKLTPSLLNKRVILNLFTVAFISLACVLVSALSGLSSQVEAAQPTFNLPYTTGTQVGIGTNGLHGCNYSSVPGYTFTNYNPTCDNTSAQDDASMDLGFYNTSGTSSTPAVALASGTVLDVWSTCRTVLIDYGGGWWGMYLHLTNLQVSTGSNVSAGTIIGYPTTNVITGSPCYEQSNFEHVHFAFLNATSSTTATFVSMAGMTLCGHTVLSNSQAPNGYYNLQGLNSPFTVPSCPGGTPGNIEVTSGISATNPVTIGGSFNGSFTVTNTGDQSFSLQQLVLSIEEPGGTSFDLATDGSYNGTDNSIEGGQTRTLTYSTSNFLSTCSGCTNGSYTLYAKWEDGSNNEHLIENGAGGNNTTTISVGLDPDHIATAANSDGALQLFTRDSQSRITTNWQQGAGGAWNGWAYIPTTLQFIGSPTVVLNSSGELQVFARATDDRIYTASETSANSYSSWSNWTELGSSSYLFAGNPDVIRTSSGLMDVFVRGQDNRIWHDYQNSGGSWSDWNAITPSGANFAGDPSVTFTGGGQEQFFALGADNTIYSAWQNSAGDNSSWSGIVDLGSTQYLFSGNAEAITSNGWMAVFARGQDNRIWIDYQNSSGWSGWTGITPSGSNFAGDPAIVSQAGRLEFFALGADNTIYTTQQNTAGDSSSWSGIVDLGSTQYLFNANPGAITDQNGLIHVYARGEDTNVWQDYQNGSLTWTGWNQASVNSNSQFPNKDHVASATNSNGALQLFTRDSQWRITTNWQQGAGGAWNGWAYIPTTLQFIGSPTVVLNSSGELQVFARATDYNIYTTWENSVNSYSSWSSWVNLGSGYQFAGSPSAINSNGLISVFARGQDNRIWIDYQSSGGVWSGWSALTAEGANFAGDPSIVINQGGGLQFFALGADSTIYTAWQNTAGDNTSWSAISDLGTTQYLFNGNAEAITVNGLMDVFALGQDGRIWHGYQDSGGSWSGWTAITPVGPQFIGDPSVLVNSGGQEEFFALGADNTIYTAWENTAGNNTSWSGINDLGTIQYLFTGNANAIIDSNKFIHVYGLGQDGRIWEDYQNSSGWNGWNPLS